jgi:hypothetical protein
MTKWQEKVLILFEEHWLFKPFRAARNWQYRTRKQLQRMWAFAMFGRENYDFDGAYLIALIVFKLKRIQRCLVNDSVCFHEPKTLQALRIAIRLGDRLSGEHYDRAMNYHNKKWGEPKTTFEPAGEFEGGKFAGQSGSIMVTNRRNVTPATAEQERQEFMAAIDADEATQTRDARWFFAIINQHYPMWWD